jgi:hypothetical protein
MPASDTSRGIAVPDERHRWRCGGCGNLTRFDVVRTATTREFWHLDLAGEPAVEQSETLEGTVSSVTCRWCGRSDAIQVVPRPEHDEPSARPSAPSTGMGQGPGA